MGTLSIKSSPGNKKPPGKVVLAGPDGIAAMAEGRTPLPALQDMRPPGSSWVSPEWRGLDSGNRRAQIQVGGHSNNGSTVKQAASHSLAQNRGPSSRHPDKSRDPFQRLLWD
jgi:hypothetical protein